MTTHKLKESEKITTFHRHRVLLRGVDEEFTINRELKDGNYLISQATNDNIGHVDPIIAFKVEHGNMKIVSISLQTDTISNLAARVDHLRFTSKEKKCLETILKLKKELEPIQKDIEMRIKRDRRYRKK